MRISRAKFANAETDDVRGELEDFFIFYFLFSEFESFFVFFYFVSLIVGDPRDFDHFKM